MQSTAYLALYTEHIWIKQIAQKIQQQFPKAIHFKGLSGSLPAVMGAALHKLTDLTQVFILQDKTEAAYFYTDLINLLPGHSVWLYPTDGSYSADQLCSDHADEVMRYSILQQFLEVKHKKPLIVTYPEAIRTGVISSNTIKEQTKILQCGEEVILSELITVLTKGHFEQVDFVQGPGEIAVRGGILDIFSYMHPLPYRIELDQRTIESIRTFNADDQRSIQPVDKASLWVPHPAIISGAPPHESFFDFLPAHTLIWLKDYEMIIDTLAQQLEKDTEHLQRIPTINPTSFEAYTKKFSCIEFGNKFYQEPQETIEYAAKSQTNFNQQYALLATDLNNNEKSGLQNFICSLSTIHLDQLTTVLNELDKEVQFSAVSIELSQGYMDLQLGLACYTEHQIFGRYYQYQSPPTLKKARGFSLKELTNLQPGDYVVHIDYGIGRFSGLSKISFNDKEQEVVRLVYKDNDIVYISLHGLHKISKYTGKEGTIPSITKLGTTAWEQKKRKVKQHVKSMAKELIQLYSKRKHTPGFAFSKDTVSQIVLETSFMYEDTPDQATASAAVKKDMETPHPMDRLVCGDVGFGKTEVAIRAAFKAIQDKKQVAILVPTTILALQHYESFKKRLAPLHVKINYVNRFKSQQEINQVRQELAQGKIDILIGTHSMLGKSFNFLDLGLLVIDEEQKFGVKAKEHMKDLKVNVDVLTLTATPIPRTLHFSLMGARDLSIINTPPVNRQPIYTAIHTFNKKIIQDAIHHEVQRGGQVFFVHNLVSNIGEVASLLQELVPHYRIGIAHGQMPGNELEKKILAFIAGKYDILVSTNIIESGLDIPNANTIIINESHMFGLSDLHQMRGRVGRSNKQAFCYLLTSPNVSLTAEARKRLATLEEFSELGDGFKVAMRDLDIRGAGNLLGAEQSGFIADVGFEAYCKILDEAVQEVKETEFKELFTEELAIKAQSARTDCSLETDLALSIPSSYVASDTERLRLYTQLDNIVDENTLSIFRADLEDRFGPLPAPVWGLIEALKLRWIAQELGLQKLKLKSKKMRCYISPSQTGLLEHLLTYVQQHPRQCQLKEINGALVLEINPIQTVVTAYTTLQQMVNMIKSKD